MKKTKLSDKIHIEEISLRQIVDDYERQQIKVVSYWKDRCYAAEDYLKSIIVNDSDEKREKVFWNWRVLQRQSIPKIRIRKHLKSKL